MSAKLVTIITGLAAVLCVVAFPIWILGVPGVQNKYAKGWGMGFEVIVAYPIAWLVNFVVFYRFDAAKRVQYESISSIVSICLLLVAVARMIQAFKTMN